MLVVVRGSPRACLERLSEELGKALSTDPIGTCVVVPTSTMARVLRSKIAAEGRTLVKSSITTLSDLVTERLHSCPRAPFVLTALESEAVIRHIMLSNKDQLPLFFADGELRLGLVPEVRAFISTTLDFNIDYPSKLGPMASDKSRQLGIIHDSYLDALHSKGYIDQHEVLSWTLCDLPNQKMWIKRLFFFGLNEPKPAELVLIKGLCAACPDATYFAVHLPGNPAFADDLSWLQPGSIEDIPPSEKENALLGVFARKKQSEGAAVHVGSFSDPREEMRAVASQIKRLLKEGVEPGRIGVMLPMRSKSAPLVRETMADFGIPANVRVPVKFSESPVVHTISEILKLALDDYPAAGIADLLSSPYIRFKFKDGQEEVVLGADAVRELSRKSRIKGGKARWLEPSPAAGENGDASEREAKTLAGIRELTRLLETLEPEKSIPNHINDLRKVLDRLEIEKHKYFQDPQVMRRGQRALRMYNETLKELENASRLFSKDKVTLELFAALHRGMLAGEEIYPDPFLENGVMVTGVRAGQLLGFDHLFIPGMVEGDIPRLDILHPFITEEEVRQLGLLTGEDILRQERYYFLIALLACGQTINLSTHRNEEDHPVLRSVFMDAVEAALVCRPMPLEDPSHSTVGSQMMVGMAIAGKSVQLFSRPYGCDLDAACLAINVEEFRRDGPYRSEHDGMLAGEQVTQDIARMHRDRTYSAKQLNMFYNCPFRYYLTYHLGMAMEQEEDEASPRNTGSAVHRVLQRFYQERCDEGRGKLTDAERDAAIASLRKIGHEEAAKGASLAWRTYMDHFIGASHPGVVTMFVDYELKNKLPDLTPKWIELSFGPHGLGDGDPTSRPEPVEIPLDDEGRSKMKLECRIDRIDADRSGRFFVYDYKSGTPMRKCMAVGDLQIPLYVLAVESAIPGSRGIGGGLYYVGSKKNTKIVPTVRDGDYLDMMAGLGKVDKREWHRGKLEKLRTETLGQMLDDMTGGRFNPSKNGKMTASINCGPDCEFYGACRFDRARALEMGLSCDVAGGEEDEAEGGEE